MTDLSIHHSVLSDPCPDRFNMAAYSVGDPAGLWPDKDALIVVDGAAPDHALAVWSFADIALAVRRAAGVLQARGLKRGERVLIRIGDGPQFPVAYFGVIAAGGVAMPLSSQLSPQELSYIARDAQPRFALLDETCPDFDRVGAAHLSPEDLEGDAVAIVDTHREEPAQLVYTSGATGKPKGVLHAHRSVWARRMMRTGWHDMRTGDRVMHTGAFNWTYVLGCGLSDPWSVGATAILNAGQRTPEVWPRLAARWQPTIFASVPGLYRRMLKYGIGLGDGFASLRHGLSAGEALSPAIHDAWVAATGKPLCEALGMSEVSTFISASPARTQPDGAMGWPQPGRHVAVLDTEGAPVPRGEAGVLAVHESDPGLMLGYWQDPDRTAQARIGPWFLTGDRVRMGKRGALSFVGRADDMMNAQGYRVAPQEVEEALALHPSVAECGVTEQNITEGLSIIAAYIVLAEGAPPDAETLRIHCAERLAAYKIPRSFAVLDTLPRTANGKLQRRALKDSSARVL